MGRETPRLIGAEIDLTGVAKTRLDALLFGETQSRVVISVAGIQAHKVLAQAKILGIPALQLGTAYLERRPANQNGRNRLLSCEVAGLHDIWWNAIARAMG